MQLTTYVCDLHSIINCFTDNLTIFVEERITLYDDNHDFIINCVTNTSVQQNTRSISWARVLYYPLFVITDTLKYTINLLDLIIHNATGDDLGIYACYANDSYTVHKVISIKAIKCT